MPTWNAEFIYDTEAGSQAALEILELTIVLILIFELVLVFTGVLR